MLEWAGRQLGRRVSASGKWAATVNGSSVMADDSGRQVDRGEALIKTCPRWRATEAAVHDEMLHAQDDDRYLVAAERDEGLGLRGAIGRSRG